MPAPLRFREVLAAAVEDLTRNGFDSSERLERWMRQLGEAARASLISAASLEQTLRDALTARYRRMVDQGGALRFNPGVDRFTLERIKPSLRGLLDRRITASADLIRLNREQAIARTIGRFQGWATSIPAGGVPAEGGKAVKKEVSKSLAQLPFVERRVLIDQGHKLVAAISDVVARDGGAIAGRWRSNWRQPGYDYREDHKDRDDLIYLVRDSWAHRAGLVRKGGAGYADGVTQPAQEPFCRCYWIWLYSLRELPEELLTAKGKQALMAVEGREEVRAARTGRADDAAAKMTQQEAAYSPVWSNRPTRCVRCSMFVLGPRLFDDNACTAVEGRIHAHGHCRLFEPSLDDRADALETDYGSDRFAFQRNLVLFHEAEEEHDRLGFLRGLKRIKAVPDTDQWHSSYEPDTDEIELQAKFDLLDDATKLHTLLHEAGHRGQDVAPEIYAEFKREHLDNLAAFKHIANPTHLADYERTGRVESGLAAEVFAESYARSMLGLEMPTELAEFWQARKG